MSLPELEISPLGLYVSRDAFEGYISLVRRTFTHRRGLSPTGKRGRGGSGSIDVNALTGNYNMGILF